MKKLTDFKFIDGRWYLISDGSNVGAYHYKNKILKDIQHGTKTHSTGSIRLEDEYFIENSNYKYSVVGELFANQINTSRFIMSWLGPCPKCECVDAAVSTVSGSAFKINDGDLAVCCNCGLTGECESDNTEGAWVNWDEVSNNTKETDLRIKELESALRVSHSWLNIDPEYRGNPIHKRNLKLLGE